MHRDPHVENYGHKTNKHYLSIVNEKLANKKRGKKERKQTNILKEIPNTN